MENEIIKKAIQEGIERDPKGRTEAYQVADDITNKYGDLLSTDEEMEVFSGIRKYSRSKYFAGKSLKEWTNS